MKKVGLITYHAAYNFGSMFQTLSTQETIEKLGYKCKVINYRLDSQKEFYKQNEYSKKNRSKLADIKDNNTLAFETKKFDRAERFEKFMKAFSLTKETNEVAPTLKIMSKFNTLVSGSDQILNKNTAELSGISYDYMLPYLLATPTKKRISFASSFCNMNDEQLSHIAPQLRYFDHFSVREPSWAEKIKKYCSTEVISVCDPTFLLSKEEWIELLELKHRENEEPFVLFYTLYSYSETEKKLKILFDKFKEYNINMKVHVVAPFSEKSVSEIDERVIDCLEFGPKEFMEDLYNATFVIPESFHGATLCAIFNKRFICPCGNEGPELRKHEVLNMVGLKSQIRPNFYEIYMDDILKDIKYDNTNKLIKECRERAVAYLKNAIENF